MKLRSKDPVEHTHLPAAQRVKTVQLREGLAFIEASPRLLQQQAAADFLASSPRLTAQLQAVHPLAPLVEDPLQEKFDSLQRVEEEEELLQGRFATAQLANDEDEEVLQGKFRAVQRTEAEEEELLQGRFAQVSESREPIQRKVDPTTEVNGIPVNDDPALEHEADVMGARAAQFVPSASGASDAVRQEKQPNSTGLPDNLKDGIEHLSGMSMDGVKVHYNSDKPSQLHALAYTQGTDIHVGPGQEQHLPHETWHVVQQKQEGGKPTMHMKGKVNVKDDTGLEKKADTMGAKAVQFAHKRPGAFLQRKLQAIEYISPQPRKLRTIQNIGGTVQRVTVTATNGTTYVVMQTIPGTGIRIVRPNWKPLSDDRFLVDANNDLINLSLTVDTARQLLQILVSLQNEHVVNRDGLVRDVAKASGLGIPLNVTLDRLRLVRNNLHDVVFNRIQADHAQIAGMYPAGTLDPVFDHAFQSIEIPGSDPHKGGQVVVFINYLTMARAPLRVVYKPSDLAMDMLLYNDVNSVAATLAGGVANYTMITRHDAAAIDPRLAHYGYMKFVESAGPRNGADMVSVFQSLGSNLAVAYVFGLRDIHHENFILKTDSIQFIDMEAATGTFTSFDAMELLTFPNALRDKIAQGLVGTANNVVRGWGEMNDATLITAVRDGFTNTLHAMRPGGPNDAAIGNFVTRASQTVTRFVPFKTEALQGLAGLFHGRLAAPTPVTTASFNDQTLALATATAGAGATPAYLADLLTMLRAQTTKDALNQGDVPYWTRQGNKIFGEDGVQQVAALAHPRLDTQANIAAGANARRTPAHVGGPLHAPPTALDLLNLQFIPLLNNISGRILNQHQFLRLGQGHGAPNY